MRNPFQKAQFFGATEGRDVTEGRDATECRDALEGRPQPGPALHAQ